MEFINNIKRSKNAGVALKSLQKAQGLDGGIWSADVYFNDRNIGGVLDEGVGHVTTNIEDKDLKAVVAALRSVDYVLDDGIEGPSPSNEFAYFERAVGCMAVEVEELKALKKATRNTTHFVRTDGKTYIAKHPFDAEMASLLRKSEGDQLVCILNEEITDL